MRRALIATVAGACLALTACGGGGTATATPSSGTPITIGVSVSLTGDFSSDGPALQKGYDLWAADVNKKGGLLGHQVTMKYVDDASSTTQVVTNYENLISSDKVALVFGPYSSLLTKPAATRVDRLGYAFPEPAGGAPSVFALGLHSLFFVQPDAVEDNLVSYTKWLLSLPTDQRPKTAAYATEDDPFTQPQIDKAKTLLEAGGITTASYKVYPAEATSWDPLALQVVHSKADVAILGTQEPDGVAFIKVFQQQHYNPKSLVETTAPYQGKDFSDKVGSANTEGIMVPAGWTPDAKAYGNSTFVNEFVAKYGGKPGDISADSAEAYSVGQVVDQAAKKANSIDNKALITALHSGSYQTIQGPISFDSVGKPQGVAGGYIEQRQRGPGALLFPAAGASAQPGDPKPQRPPTPTPKSTAGR